PLPDLLGVLTQIDNASTIARQYRAERDAARAAALDECEAVARGELWFPDKYNSRYRCEVGNGENKDALNWSIEGDYGKARNAAADRIASLKRGPVAEESGE